MSGDTCDLCGARVTWVRVPSGRRIPLETVPDARPGVPKAFPDTPGRGRIQSHPDWRGADGWDLPVVRVLPEAAAAEPEQPIWRSHYAVSCKGVRQRRRRRWV